MSILGQYSDYGINFKRGKINCPDEVRDSKERIIVDWFCNTVWHDMGCYNRLVDERLIQEIVIRLQAIVEKEKYRDVTIHKEGFKFYYDFNSNTIMYDLWVTQREANETEAWELWRDYMEEHPTKERD